MKLKEGIKKFAEKVQYNYSKLMGAHYRDGDVKREIPSTYDGIEFGLGLSNINVINHFRDNRGDCGDDCGYIVA